MIQKKLCMSLGRKFPAKAGSDFRELGGLWAGADVNEVSFSLRLLSKIHQPWFRIFLQSKEKTKRTRTVQPNQAIKFVASSFESFFWGRYHHSETSIAFTKEQDRQCYPNLRWIDKSPASKGPSFSLYLDSGRSKLKIFVIRDLNFGSYVVGEPVPMMNSEQSCWKGNFFLVIGLLYNLSSLQTLIMCQNRNAKFLSNSQCSWSKLNTKSKNYWKSNSWRK